MVVTGASGDFTVGETITGNSSTAPTAEVVTWTTGTNTLTLKYVSSAFTPSSETITVHINKTATVSSITYLETLLSLLQFNLPSQQEHQPILQTKKDSCLS